MAVQIGAIEGLFKIRDEGSGVLLRAAAQMEQVGKRMEAVGRQMSDIGGTLTKSVTLPILAVGGAATKLATDFESSFAGVRKTLDTTGLSLEQTEAEFARLEKGLREMSAGEFAIPIDVNELNAIAESAGQLGIARQDILAFTRVMADLANTTNLTSEEAATSIAQIQNIFGAAGKDVDRFGATLVALGNKGASTEKNIVEMAQRIAGSGKQIGLTQGEVLAFANALASVGINAEAGGSAISKVMIEMALAVERGGKELHNFNEVARSALPAGKDFATVFREDAAQAVNAFVVGLGNIEKSGGSVLGVLDQLEITETRMRDALLAVAGSGTILSDSLKLQAEAWEDNAALTDEAAKRYTTFDSQLKIVTQKLKDAGITLGQALLPSLKEFLDSLTPLIAKLAELAKWFGDLPKPIRTTMIVMAALAAAVGPVVFVTGQLIMAWGQIVATGPAVVKALLAVKAAHLGIAGVLVGVVAGVALVDHWIKENQKHQKEYQAALERTNELLGISRAKHLSNADALFQEAKAVLRLLEAELQRQRAEVSSLSRVNPYFDENLSAGEQERMRSHREKSVQEDLKRTEAALADAREAYVRLEGARANLEPPPEIVPPPVPDPNPVDLLADDIKRLMDRLKELRAELIRTAAQNRQIAAVWRAGGIDRKETERQIEAVERSHALHNAYLSDVAEFGKKAADALRSLRAASYDTAEAAEDAKEAYEGLISAFEQTADLSGTQFVDKFFADMKQAVRTGAEQLERDAQEAIRRIDLLRDLENEAEFALRVIAIDETAPGLRQIEENFLSLLRTLGEGSVSKGEEVFAEMAKELGITVEQIKAHLQTIANVQIAGKIRGASDSTFSIYKQERDEIETYLRTSVARTSKEWEDGTAYISQLSTDFWSGQLNTWSGVLDQLADRFGGFFNYLAQAARTLQQAQGTASSLSSAASGLGASAGMAAALGAFGAYVVIAMAIYDAFKSHAESRQARKYDYGAVVSMTDGQWNVGQMADASEKLSNEIKKLVDAFVNSIGGLLTGFADLEIQIRRDGKYFKAFIEGELIGQFESMEEAVSAAIVAAFGHAQTTIAGVSQEFAHVMQEVTGRVNATMEELQAAIETARTARAARLGEVGSQLLDVFEEWNREIRAADRLGLAIGDMVAARDREAAAIKNNVLGIDTAVSDQLRALRSLNTGMIEAGNNMRAQMEAQIRMAQEQLARLLADRQREAGPGGGQGGSGRGGGGSAGGARTYTQSRWDEEIARLQAQIDRYLEELGRIPQALSDAEINMGIFDALYRYLEGNMKYEEDRIKYARMKVEIEFASIRLQLELLGKWEQFAGMFTDAYNAAVAAAGKPVGRAGGGRGSSDRDTVRDFIADRSFELALRNMSEWDRTIAELNKQYDELLAKAGKDAALRAELIALRDKELALMAQQAKDDIVAKFRDFVGLANPFDAVRKTAEGLIKDIEDSPLGDARKANMIGRVLVQMDEQIQRISDEMAQGLLGSLIGDMERFGASEALLMQARKAMAVLEHTLKMEHYRAEIAILKAQGKLSEQTVAALDAAFNFLSGIDPLALFGPPAGDDGEPSWSWRQGPGGYYLGPRGGENDTPGTPIDDFNDAVRRATDLLRRYQDEGLSGLHRSLQQIHVDFSQIRAALGDTPEVIAAHQEALRRVIEEWREPIRQARRDMFFGEGSPVDVMGQFDRLMSEYTEAQRRFAAGDLAVVDTVPALVQQLRALGRQVNPIGSTAYTRLATGIDDFLALIEATDPTALDVQPVEMMVGGMDDLNAVNEAQLDRLSDILTSTERTAVAVEAMSARSAFGNFNAVA